MYAKIIEAGLLLLLIYSPFALGAVTPGAVALVQIISGLLLLIWLIGVLTGEQQVQPSASSGRQRRRHPKASSDNDETPSPNQAARANADRRGIKVGLITIITILWLLILVQFMPLPAVVVQWLSPAAYRLYAEGASATATDLPGLLPLTVCSQATEAALYQVLAYLSIFVVMVHTLRNPKQVNRIIVVILTVGFLQALYGLIQFVSGHHRVYTYRVSAWVHGTFINKNHFAGYMEMVILLMFGLLFTRFELSSSALVKLERVIEEKYMKALSVLFVLFLMISAHLLSGSRGGILSLMAGILVFALLAYGRQLLRKWVVIMLVFLPVAVGFIAIANPTIISNRLRTLQHLETDASFQTRWELWKSALAIFRDYPLVGSGAGTFAHLARRYQPFQRRSLRFKYPENDYLQLLAETGVIGSSLVLGAGVLFLYYTFTAWRRRHSRRKVAIGAGGLSALVSLLVHSGMDFNLHIPSNALLFTVIAALTYVTVTRDTDHNSDTRRMKTDRRERVKTNLAVAGIGLTLFYLIAVANTYYARGHFQAVADGLEVDSAAPSDPLSPQQVVQYLQTAIWHDRNHAEYYYTLGAYLAHHEAAQETAIGQFEEAAGLMQRAILLDPANPWYYYDMGRLAAKQAPCSTAGGREAKDDCAAVRYLLAALRNAPTNTFLRQNVGRWYYHYDPTAADQLLHELIAADDAGEADNPQTGR